MQLELFRRLARVSVVLASPAFLAIVAGCPSTPPNDNTNTNNNGDPEPPDPVRIDVTWTDEGDVEQEADGSMVTLTAIPADGWEWSGLTGADVPNENPVTVDANEVTAITASSSVL